MIQPNNPQQPFSSNSDGHLLPVPYLDPEQMDFSADYHLKLGKSFIQSYLESDNLDDLENAVHHFQKAVEMAPKMPEAYLQLAIALWEQGSFNFDLAQYYCQMAINMDPTCWEAYLYMGYFFQRQGLLEDAQAYFNQALLNTGTFTAKPHLALSVCLAKQSQEHGLLAHGFKGIGLALKSAWHGVLGVASLPFDGSLRKVFKNAFISDFRTYGVHYLAVAFKKLQLPKLSERVYRLGTQMAPGDSVFLHLLGDDYFYDSENPANAIPCYEEALAREPHQVDLMKKLARAYVANQQFDEALQQWSQILEQCPNDFDTFYQMAQFYTDQNAYMKALYYFKEAGKLQPHNPYVHSNMGYVLFKLDDMEGALEEYKAALNDGTDAEWMSSIAQTIATITYKVYEDFQAAIEYLHQSLHFNPTNRESMATLGDLYFETNQLDQALSAYTSLLFVDPENSDCHSNIGYILWQLDRNDEAIEAYRKAIELNPHNYIAHNNLGVIFLDEQQSPEEAVGCFEQAFSIKKDYTLACFNIGRAQEYLGLTMEAAQSYSQALNLNKLNPELEEGEIQERLEALFD